jgi:hypothetical protein
MAPEHGLLEAKQRGGDLHDAIAAGVGWSRFEAAVARAEALSAPEALDLTVDLGVEPEMMRHVAPLGWKHWGLIWHPRGILSEGLLLCPEVYRAQPGAAHSSGTAAVSPALASSSSTSP